MGRNRQLIANQAVPERYVDELRRRLRDTSGVEDVQEIEAVYLGPGEVMVAAQVQMDPQLSGVELTDVLARVRDETRREFPVIARMYLTPVRGSAPRP